jgi:hypothetical protein
LTDGSDTNWKQKQAEDERKNAAEHLRKADAIRPLHAAFSNPIARVEFILDRTFEHLGADVAFNIEAKVSIGNNLGRADDFSRQRRLPSIISAWWVSGGKWSSDDRGRGAMRVEIKPAVADDYPAVLRQMRASQSTVLFLEEYRGKGATREQFIKTFASAGIAVVFKDQVQ